MDLSAETLTRLEPIRGLSPIRLKELARVCHSKTYPLGSNPLLEEKSSKAQFLYLLSGELKIVLLDGSMRLLVGGCDMANWPIGYKTVFPVSCKAITEIELLRIDFDLLDIMMTWDELSRPSAGQDPQPDETIDWSAIASTACALAKLSPVHIVELLKRFERIKCKRGEKVIREGDVGDFYYLIESGRCEVSKRVGGVDISLAELKVGDTFGEEALVSNAPRNATVSMKAEGVLLRLPKADFIELLQRPLLHGIHRATAESHIKNGHASWLDVRYPAEFSQDGLPDAINLPLNEIRDAFDLLDKNREYIVYCQSGRRSAAAAFLLSQRGFKASWLLGGINPMENQ